MEAKISELDGKFKALNMILEKTNDAVTERNKVSLVRNERSINNKVAALYVLKEEIEELKFINKESEDNVQEWAKGIETKLNDVDTHLIQVRDTLDQINNEEASVQGERDEEMQRKAVDEETQKQLSIEKAKLELQRIHKEEERKREKEHQEFILKQKMDFEKTIQTSVEKQSKQVQNIKLPKLQIRKFSGKFSDWFPFWNTFEAEIDSTDLPAVSKFGFLKELLEPKIRADIDGLPFTTEGYERAKNILKNEYGKTSEIINAHIQNIMGLPTVTGTNPAKVHEFYKTLSYNVQSLETLGKIERVNGTTRSVLEKLKGIKADLVRGEHEWQDWDLPRLVTALKKWKDIHTLDDASNESTKPKRDSKFFLTKDSECKKRTCVYCEESTHSPRDCSTVLPVSARKKVLAEKKRCFNCTGLKHRASDCKSNINCQKCNQKHHTSICPQVVPLLTATGTSYEPLVYPVVVVNVEGEKCRALLDTGAGSSYASAVVLNRLSHREHRKEVRHVEMMLGTVTREMEISTINVEALDRKFEMKVNVTKVDKNELFER